MTGVEVPQDPLSPGGPEPPTARRVRKSKTSREQLLLKAAEAFSSRGYGSTSIKDLADALGVNKSAIYHYFESKEDLLFEISRDAMVVQLVAIKDIVGRGLDVRSEMREVLFSHVRNVTGDLPKHATMLAELKALSPHRRAEIVALRDEYEAIIASILQRGLEQGEFETGSLKYARLATLGAVNWIVHWYRPGRGSADEIARHFVDFILAALTPARPRDGNASRRGGES